MEVKGSQVTILSSLMRRRKKMRRRGRRKRRRRGRKGKKLDHIRFAEKEDEGKNKELFPQVQGSEGKERKGIVARSFKELVEKGKVVNIIMPW